MIYGKLGAISLLFFLFCSFLKAQIVKDGNKLVYVIPIRDEIEQTMVYVVKRGVNEAIKSGAIDLIIDLNTPGGQAESMEKIIQQIERFPFQENTFAFVNHKAYSAGAFVAAACRHIYMAPGSVIGAATPVMFSPQGGIQNLPESYEKKILSAYQGLIRAIAERHGHNPAVFNAMVDRDSGLVIDGKEILPKGKVLTLTDTEAIRQYGNPPKPLLAEGIVPSLEQLVEKVIGTKAIIIQLKPTGFEKIGRMMTMLGPLFLTLGLLLAYLELQTGGIALGILSLFFFSLYFLGHYLAGLSGFEPFFLFLLGVSLVLAEVFFFPGLVIPTLMGLLMVVIAILTASAEKLPTENVGSWLARMREGLISLIIAIGSAFLLIFAFSRFIPKRVSIAWNKEPQQKNERTDELFVGMEGQAVTVLRPSGLGRFKGKVVDVVSLGEFIAEGTPIRIVRIEGIRIVVEAVDVKSKE
ncbi:serine protease [Candidatus Methylacidiphilum fumarolicum]|nr:NfeD family protein [Candidatus Methylacidiphilum fumarolicum]MBW6414911.1 serine protease [Candidatus Methylacidiphilum fumarolicum]TFE67031.1 serine protease [Candidatus Methylacidiphilum fumarolicum]TFE71439.1 serine protease [Candidatus Methylacidiphilum fumarolicum]TFE72633.1 serine protease [Candidatus Methylacidiphilum fumarolicum]TFE74404.1 serine protease [Candidatus Methylacidiphilum fumarolicum]